MSSKPSLTTIPKAVGHLEVRQHMLEDGTIIDIPAAVLYSPPPKPIEFLYLKHYYQAPSGVKRELKEAGSPEAAIDILAAELEGMRHLLTGYVHTWEKYVEKFEAEHEAIRKDIASIVESYKGLRAIVKSAAERAPLVEAAFFLMQEKVSKLRIYAHTRAPPKIVRREGFNGAKNPPLTREEAAEVYQRFSNHKLNADNSIWVAKCQDALKQRVLLAELTTPPSLPQSDPAPAPATPPVAAPVAAPAAAPAAGPAAVPAVADKNPKRADKAKSKGKGKAKEAQDVAQNATPLDPRVEVKIEKLAGGLDAMRDTFRRVHAKTEQDLLHLRVLNQEEKLDAEEVWAAHDGLERTAFVTGKINSRNLPRIQAYDRWATKCLEDKAAEASKSTDADSTASDRSSTPSTVAWDAPASQSSAANNEIYTVSLNVKYEKDLDKLTREEAIEMLKALPLRIQFAPFGPAEDEEATAVNGAVPQDKRQDVPNVADDTASGAGQPPVAKKSKAGAGSRKRARTSEDAGETQTDSLVAAEAPPAKKLRLQKE